MGRSGEGTRIAVTIDVKGVAFGAILEKKIEETPDAVVTEPRGC